MSLVKLPVATFSYSLHSDSGFYSIDSPFPQTEEGEGKEKRKHKKERKRKEKREKGKKVFLSTGRWFEKGNRTFVCKYYLLVSTLPQIDCVYSLLMFGFALRYHISRVFASPVPTGVVGQFTAYLTLLVDLFVSSKMTGFETGTQQDPRRHLLEASHLTAF